MFLRHRHEVVERKPYAYWSPVKSCRSERAARAAWGRASSFGGGVSRGMSGQTETRLDTATKAVLALIAVREP
jgi:hypothetical protein